VARDPFNPQKLYAATLTEIHVSEDDGASWQWLPSGGIDRRDIWTMAVHPTRANEIYLGTLPAAVYVSENGGRSFRELAAFRNLPDYNKWTFPPGAHVAHARCITLDRRVPDEIIVGIEEGGVARSRDRGAIWEDISGPASPTAFPKVNDPAGIVPYEMGQHEEGRVYRDVHWVTRHPNRLETLFASTGIGTYRTDDGGKNWTKCEYGMGRAYAIPMTNHPSVPDRIFLGAAENGPATWPGYRTVRAGPYNTVKFSRNAFAQTGGAKTQILRSDDAGNTWNFLKNGLPSGHEHMTCGFASHPEDADTLCVAYTDGSVYASNDAGASWRRLIVSQPKLYGVRLMATA
jgi:hypothetical protein